MEKRYVTSTGLSTCSANINIVSNTFYKIIGCPLVTASLISILCLGDKLGQGLKAEERAFD